MFFRNPFPHRISSTQFLQIIALDANFKISYVVGFFSQGDTYSKVDRRNKQKRISILTKCGLQKQFMYINKKAKIHKKWSQLHRVVFLFFSGYDKDNQGIIYLIGDKNETYYFKQTYNCYRKAGGVKSRLIKECAYNKIYPLELSVLSKKLEPSPLKIKSKENNNSNNNKIKNRSVLPYI